MSELYHYGIKGMHWGVRRFQNANGTLTDAGRKRYGVSTDSLSGYSKIAGSKAVTKMRKKQTYRTDVDIARLNREKANIKNAMRELDDEERAASTNGVYNSNWSKAGRMAKRAQLMRQEKYLDQKLSESNKVRSELITMEKNAQKYKKANATPLTPEQKATARKGQRNRMIDNQKKALTSGAVTAGISFGATVLGNKMIGGYANPMPIGVGAARGFVTGYAMTNVSQLYKTAGLHKKR